MSLKGFKRDEGATTEARLCGLLADRRSFISLPKVIAGECDEPQPHWILFGEQDKGRMRAEIFRRNRAANDGVNRCWKCDREVDENLTTEGEYYIGEWDHIRNKSGERCDCPGNGRVSCCSCHSKQHVRVKWSANENIERRQESSMER